MDKNRFGDRVRIRRTELGLSQEELAKRLGYTSRSTINKIESGINDVGQSKVLEFAKALETTVPYLMAWDSNENDSFVPSDFETALILAYRSAPESRREAVRTLLDIQKKGNDEPEQASYSA